MIDKQQQKTIINIQSELATILMYLNRDKNSLNEYIEDINNLSLKLKEFINSQKEIEE